MINKAIKLFIISIVLSNIATIYITKNIIEKNLNTKYNSIIHKIYADIIYSFSNNKELIILETSTSIMGSNISYIGIDDKIKLNNYKNLCPNINKEFKNTILNYYNKQIQNSLINFKEEQSNFLKGYSKLSNFCKNKV